MEINLITKLLRFNTMKEKIKLKLWVDDIRSAPNDKWQVVRNVSEAIRAINMFDFFLISLDHDVEGSNEDFSTVALFIAEKYKDKNVKPKIILHTANPVGVLKMKNILDGFDIEINEAMWWN